MSEAEGTKREARLTLGSMFAKTTSNHAKRSIELLSNVLVTAAPTDNVIRGESCCMKPGFRRAR